MTTVFVLGFDPGGAAAFGWCALASTDGQVSLIGSGTCSSASAALAATRAAIPSQPAAFAVDAPLFWLPAGDRNADKIVRKMVCAAGGSSGTVGHINSLRGACLVQGIMVTQMAATLWPDAKVSEAHPKALLRVSSAAQTFAATVLNKASTEHERDAGLAAFTALNLLSASVGWHNLVEYENGHHFPTGKTVTYWFPRTRA